MLSFLRQEVLIATISPRLGQTFSILGWISLQIKNWILFLLPLSDYDAESSSEIHQTQLCLVLGNKTVFVSFHNQLDPATLKESCVWDPELAATYSIIRWKQLLQKPVERLSLED